MAHNGDAESLPLKGVVLCCTSLAQDVRAKLAQDACQMGAVHKLDLTSDVTHLLVGSITTAKYRYVAKERPDIRVLALEFVEAVRVAWMEGGDVDVEALETKYTIPPFLGLQVCLTGFDDLAKRKNMEETLVANGATYHGDLTRAVTHLIAARPEGAKYTHAKQWKIHVLGVKWYEDCLLRGMAVDESLYMPELPREQQGIGAFRIARKETNLGKRRYDGEPAHETSRRKLRKVASTRLDSQSQDMWRNISQADVQVDNTELDAWTDDSNTLPHEVRPQRDPKVEQSGPFITETRQGLFSGHYTLLRGFEETRAKKLRLVLQQNGAVMVESEDDLEAASHNADFRARCLLVPHNSPTTLPTVPPATVVVTEWWVERCLHYKQYIEPDSDVLSSPLSDCVVQGFANLTISTTGFSGVDMRQIAEAVKLMGATYQEQLLPSTNVLVCATGSVKKEKAYYASKHGINAVSSAWLWESMKAKKSASIDEYRLQLPAFDPSEFTGEPSTGSLAPTAAHPPQTRRSDSRAERVDEHMQPKRLSNTRRRHATPSLTLKASRPSHGESQKARAGPFILEDDEDEDASLPYDDTVVSGPQRDSLPTDGPLREISPNASQHRSPHGSQGLKSREELHNAGGMFQIRDIAAAEVEPVSPPKSSSKSPKQSGADEAVLQAPSVREGLTSNLASLIQRRASSNPAQVGIQPQKRKHRPLGRNLSGISNRSGSIAVSPALDVAEAPEMVSVSDGFYVSREDPVHPPGTQLGYETAEAEAYRLQMSKKMGKSTTEEGRRITTVTNVRESEGMRTRAAASGAAGARRSDTKLRGKS